MKQEEIWSQLITLPPAAQQQVADFIAFLRVRYASARARKAVKRTELANEAFVGMWRNRNDLQDSSNWVRGIREREWVSRHA